MSSLHLTHLSVAYKRNTVLNAITLAPLVTGQVVALLGPNAAGKSTLQKAIAGLIPASGNLHLNDIDLATLSRRERLQRIGYLPQTLPQASALLVYEVIYSGLRAGCPHLSASAATLAVEKVLTLLDLHALALRPLNELSGGQRQMVGLAQVVARQPEVLLLDEPTSALDLRWQLRVIEAVRNLAQQSGAICVLAVHDLNLALRFCDRIVVLAQGSVQFDGTPQAFSPELLQSAWGVTGRVENCSLGYRSVTIDAAHIHPTRELA